MEILGNCVDLNLEFVRICWYGNAPVSVFVKHRNCQWMESYQKEQHPLSR